MTVSSTTVKNSYSGNSSTTAFAYTFKIFADTDLEVIIRSSTGTETTKTLTTHYTVSGAGDASGGNVTFTSGNTPATGETVVIRRGVPQTQAIDYIANDPFPAESHEEGLDRGTMTTQQVQEEVDRSLKISRTNTMTSTEFTTSATDRANKVLSFDGSGELAVTQELGTYKGTDATVTTAAYNVRDIIKSTTSAQLNNVYICVADSVVGDSLTDTDHFELLVDAVSAATSATASATSATASASSATASASSASTASTQASNAATSATASANSATAAATSATEAAASADAFDDIYLGSKSSDPSTDNDGDALAAGMLYFNTTNDILRVYSGSAWQDAAISSTGVVTLTGTQTLTNKTLTAPKVNEDVAVTSTATELNLLDGATVVLPAKIEGTNFTDSLLVGHATTGTLSSAEDNTGIGIAALDALTSGDANTAVGNEAGTGITTSGKNTAVGMSALTAVTTSTGFNSAFGRSALQLVTGSYNTGIGAGAGENITSGSGNVIIGKVNAGSATGDRQLLISGNDGSTTTNWIAGTSAGAITFNGAYTFPTSDGSANQVLKTDGSGSLSFATTSAVANTPLFRAFISGSDQTIPNSTYTKVQYNAETFDPSGVYDHSTNYRFTPGVAGYFLITAQITSADVSDWNNFRIRIYKNGSAIANHQARHTHADSLLISTMDLSDDNDYYEIYVYQSSGSNKDIRNNDASNWFQAFKIIS